MVSTWGHQLNTTRLANDARAHAVYCASDELLYNAPGVGACPPVHHYRDGKRVASWSGGRRDGPERLEK